MKTYHKLGLVAVVWTAFACAMIAHTASAAADVYSIERYLDPTGQAVNDPLSVSSALQTGQKVMFKLRLLNRTELQTRMGNGSVTNKWDFHCLNGPASWDEVVAIHNSGGDWLTALNEYFVASEHPLQIGVWVNGCTKPAKIESFVVSDGVDDPSNPGAPFYTDMICSYTVENGDFALPLKLSVKAGGQAVEYGASPLQSEYYLFNTDYWKIMNASNDVCVLQYNANQSELQWAPHANNKAYVDLVGAAIYIKTVDFDDAYSRKPDGTFDPDNDIWFEVPQNGTVGQENRHGPVLSPGLATVNGQPVATGNDVKNLYVWTEDETQIRFPASVATTSYNFFDGSTHSVRCLQLLPTETNITFMLEAPAEATTGRVVRVYLSSTPTNIYDSAQTLIPNFVTRLVKVGPPDPPKVKVTINDSTTDSTLAVPLDSGYVAQLIITPTAAFSNEFTVTLAPEMVSGSAEEPWAFIGISTANGESEGYLKREASVTFGAGSTASKSLYVYASRTSSETSELANGIRFVPTLPDPLADNFYTNNAAARLRIASAPIVESPTEDDITVRQCNVEEDFLIKVKDLYGELTNTYTVKWIDNWANSSAPPLSSYTDLSTDAIPDGERNLNVKTKFLSSGNKTAWFYVINSDGVASSPQKTTFVVSDPMAIRIPAMNDAAYEYADPPIVAEGAQIKVSFQFSPSAYEGATAYLFLVPQSDDATNRVSYASGTGGWETSRTEIRSNTGTATVMLKALDGFREDANFRPEFKVVLRTANRWDDGEEVPAWSSDENTRLTFGVTNIAPVVKEVRHGTYRMNGTTRQPGGNVYLGMVPANRGIVVDVPTTFSIPAAGVGEPSQLDLTDTNRLFSTVWVWENQGTEDRMYGNPQGTNVTHTFTSAGTNQVSVYMWDKDMDDYELGATFDVVVSAAPAITITADDGITQFPEADGHGAERNLTISLGTLPPGAGNSVTVHLEVRRTDTRTAVMPTLNVTDVVFSNNETTSKPGAVKLTPLDGPGNFEIYACVTNTGDSPYGVTWPVLYPANSEFKFSVDNEKPVLNSGMEMNVTNNASINMVTEVPWTLEDVWADMTNNMSITWMVDGAQKESYILDDVVDVPYSGVFTNVFIDPGLHTVTLRVMDKDKATSSWTYYYYVEQSKSLFIYPLGPARGLNSDFTQKYTSQGVIGEGRVWASGTAPSIISAFEHTWTYGPKAQQTAVFAHGYRVGDVDNGSLLPAADYGIDSTGAWSADRDASFSDWYVYDPPDGLDSFFYCWILNTGEDGGTYTAARLGGFQPELLSTDNGKTTVGLPPYEENSDEPYENRNIEALFSKEYLKTDNAGDINQDGIPDVFAVRFWPGAAQTLFEFCGGDAANGGDLLSLMSKEHKNDDQDYLPRKAHGASPLNGMDSLVPDTEENWTTMGEPFTTILEIRGFHNGLNLRKDNGAKQGPYTTGAWISDRDYSPAEYMAWTNAWEKAVSAGFTGTPEEFELGKDGFGPWSPENRTDPTTADTDGDGLEDGYEYYFWYYAHVGWIGADGKLRQLEGEKFSLDDISKGIRMPPEEVERLFNPNDAYSNGDGDASTRDSDGDGLTDLEELAIGTNPIHWDTDGDGVSDLWEVLRGIDPLTAELGEAANPDNDYMAYAEISSDCALLSVSNATTGVVSLYAVTNIGDGLLIGSDGTFNADLAEGALAIPVYRYGRPDVSPLVPLNRGKWKSNSITTIAGGKTESLQEWVCTTNKPLQEEAIDWTDAFTTEDVVDANTGDTTTTTNYLVEVKLKQTLALVHDQVRAEFGFDPRTAWYMNPNGFVANRWDPANALAGWDNYLKKNKVGGYIGLAQNTKPYLNEDEYLLLKYHYKTRAPGGLPFDVKYNPKDGSDVTYDVVRDKAAIEGRSDTLENIFLCGTTHCSTNVIWTRDAMGAAYASVLVPHGADTDGNGVPDGWEAYVGFNPSHNFADGSESRLMTDGTTLCISGNYAGTDSCNAYSNVTSIIEIHPGKTKGWYNKFWPTDPWNGDTDGDRISDATEGSTWQGGFPGAGDEDNSTYTFTFIYGSPEDNGELCIRGGGMNPCTVDTDFDQLPDTWEMKYAGVVFSAAGQPVSADAAYQGASGGGSGSNAVSSAAAPAQISEAAIKKMRRNDGLKDDATALKYYISGGMDATHGPNPGLGDKHTGDAYTSTTYTDPHTGTTRNFDFDNDGLQNYQEYLVQTLRHLRYDDSETPLMGRSLVSAGNEQKGPFVPMHFMDGDTFFAEVQAAGYASSSAWNFRELGYFARPPRDWDPMANRGDHDGKFNGVDEAGFRLMLPPQLLASDGKRKPASGYASTDPRAWDTDGDGMDDYYEIFHGLNPLLGSVFGDGDVISGIYGSSNASFWYNAWTGWPMMPPMWGDDTAAYPLFDAVKYPWMMGTLEADADGDGIRNGEEAIRVDVASPQPTHTDPTPLWMTDSSSGKSYTAQYYLWPRITEGGVINGAGDELARYWDGNHSAYMFSFEENEGYDTDGDGIPDGEEKRQSSTAISDALKFTDPDQRQAVWFPGNNSALATKDAYHIVGSREDFLRQFTVEAWIRPEALGTQQTIVERVADYGASTLSNNVAKVRANFRIGIAADGRLYGVFDTSDAVTTESDAAFVWGNTPELNAWTHVALTYDGKELTLYINGIPMTPSKTALAPANGSMLKQQELGENGAFSQSWDVLPCAFVIGASAQTAYGIQMMPGFTTWSDFGNFYAGYVDEVRVWDGARTLSQIQESMNKRFTFDDVAALREEIYEAYNSGATRNDNDTSARLPAELVQHYGFQALPGAVNAADVAWEPSGFTKNVVGNIRQNGYPIDGDIYCGWWKSLDVHSTVYRNYRWVPWARNTCLHLPPMDGSCLDSYYWADYLTGVLHSNDIYGEDMENGPRKMTFPNTANPYSYYISAANSGTYGSTLNLLAKVVPGVGELNRRYNFWSRYSGTSDLLPLGGAFAKRVSEMWDGEGPADASPMTGRDLNANGIPDWWELIAKGEYGAADGFDWNSIVTYDGRQMTAREAYLRDLMKGMQPDGAIDEAFRSIADSNKNGLPDWWESLKGLVGAEALADADNDGLANYAEFLISESFSGFPPVDPTAKFTFAVSNDVSLSYAPKGQIVPDYFLRVGKVYLGEIFGDHDFMDDEWEDLFDPDKVSRFTFDAWTDPDGDGWSNFAEARAGTDPTKTSSPLLDGEFLSEYPNPAMRLRAVYSNKEKTLAGADLVVQAYRADSLSGSPIAVWRVGAGNAQTITRNLGMNPGTKVTLNLGPGSIIPASVSVEFRDLNAVTQTDGKRISSIPGNTTWHLGLVESITPGENIGILNKATVGRPAGTVNYETGDVELDFTKMQDYIFISDTWNWGGANSGGTNDWERVYAAKSYVRISWRGKVDASERVWETSLSVPNVSGHLREGKTVFVAFADVDGDGAWTAGEPYGVVKDVDVGWAGNAVELELTDTAPQVARVKLAEGIGATGLTPNNTLTDRSVNGAYYLNTILADEFVGTVVPPTGATRVRIVRSAINGSYLHNGVDVTETVFEKVFNLDYHPVLTEMDILGTGKLDLDWSTLLQRWGTGSIAALTNVTYRIVLGEGSETLGGNNYPLAFVNAFERGAQQTKATINAPKGTIYSGQPEFSWTHVAKDSDGRKVKDYPAFRLRVWKGASGGTAIYDSGAQPAPPRDANGIYRWKAPIYANMKLPSGTVFSTTNNYYWSVSMLDAKFTAPNSEETRQLFRMEASGALGTISDYGAVKACVRYFGPAPVTNVIHVQAYTSPDFTGFPAGEGYVTNKADLASISSLAPNAVILGLKPGTYYLRAYLDSDGNNGWSKWETWGYANYVGTEVTTLYTPRPITLVRGQAIPEVTIYMEDMDTDADTFPDAWEWTKYGSLGKTGSPSGATFFTRVNTNLLAVVNGFQLGSAGKASSVRPMTLMNSMLTGTDADSIAAAVELLGDGSDETAGAEVQVRIDSFSLEGGISLTVTNDAQPGDYGVFTVADSANVDVYLVASNKPDFSDNLPPVKVGTITIAAGKDATESISAEAIADAIRDADLGDAAFFKVRLEQ